MGFSFGELVNDSFVQNALVFVGCLNRCVDFKVDTGLELCILDFSLTFSACIWKKNDFANLLFFAQFRARGLRQPVRVGG